MEKQLAVEQRVKEGAESMIRTITKARTKQDRALLSKAQQMLDDSRTKVEVLKMRILKLKSESATSSAGDTDEKKKSLANTPEGRIMLLRYRVDVETRLLQGARSIIKAQSEKKADRKNLEMVCVCVCVCACAYACTCACVCVCVCVCVVLWLRCPHFRGCCVPL